jgi:hypothetical protein
MKNENRTTKTLGNANGIGMRLLAGVALLGLAFGASSMMGAAEEIVMPTDDHDVDENATASENTTAQNGTICGLFSMRWFPAAGLFCNNTIKELVLGLGAVPSAAFNAT